MDHLPTPKNVVIEERAVAPYVCLKHYDGGPFITYPIREGVTHALPPDGNVPGGSPYLQHERRYPTPKQEQEDFLQRWLFFGLSHEILGDRYRPEELVYTIETDGRETNLISTSGLVEALDKWIADIHAGAVNPRHTYEHIAECLRLAFATIRGAGPDFDQRIKVSLASVGELFTFATDKAYGFTPEDTRCPDIHFSRLIDYAYWKDQMLSSGWCPSQMDVIANTHPYLQTLHFLMFLGQPASGKPHLRCNSDRCLAYQNDMLTYQTKHVTGCKCEHISIDTKRLTEILQSGSVPLLRIHKGHTLNELSVELVPSLSTSHYIALSHVWADGLGNPYENALPRCQLVFLHQTINEYYAKVDPQATEKILLWCDTLCCPVDPGEAKNMALTHMKKVYMEATRVLVLDASLQMYDLKTMDTVEACIRILSSGWMRRLWTLQEGALPARNFRLSFLFKDEAINLHHFMHRLFQESSISQKGLEFDLKSRITHFASIPYEFEGDQREDLGTVEGGLLHRSVSVPSDEPLLIANLLDLDVSSILSGPCPLADCVNVGCDHSRIHRLWLLMPTAFRGIPRNILLRVGPRLGEPGFRWAPSTLLYNQSGNFVLYPRTRVKVEVLHAPSEAMYGPQGVMFSTLTPRFSVLLSIFWNPLASFLFYIRARLETVRWTPAVLRNPRRMRLVAKYTSRGIPTGRGLLVDFTGYSLSMVQCPPGIPSNPWNLIEHENSLYARGIDGTWYTITRRLPAEQDSFLSTKSLRAVVREEGNLWVIHEESAFDIPERIAEAPHVTIGLLVQLISDEEGIKYVQSKLHVAIGLARKSLQTLLEGAYQSAKHISRDLPAKQFAAKSNGEQSQNEADDVNPPQYISNREALEQEIHRVAIQNADQDVTAAAAIWVENAIAAFQELIAMMVLGRYSYLGPRTADEQKWCFD